MTEADAVSRTLNKPATQRSLAEDLRRLGVRSGSVILVHSSLSSLGWVVGGAQTAILAIEHAAGDTGTVVMPAFSDSAPEPSRWRNPAVPEGWWATIREEWPPFDPEFTPTRGVGTIPELFRNQAGTFRSVHPNDSFAARGPAAARLLHPHDLDYGLGEGSPLGRLYAADASVLLLGTGHDTNSSLHLAEARASWPGKMELLHFRARIAEGDQLQDVRFSNWDVRSDDFASLGSDFERETTVVRSGTVGMANARLMRQRDLVDYGVDWLTKHRRPA